MLNWTIIFYPSALFGYRTLLTNDKHNISAVCLENCKIKFYDKDTFNLLIDNSPRLTRQILSRLSHEFSVLINRITTYSQNGIRGRLAWALLVLNEKFKIPNSKIMESNIRISRTNIAAFIGTSIDVVSRNLKYYEEQKIIRTHGKSIYIVDFEYLLKASGVL